MKISELTRKVKSSSAIKNSQDRKRMLREASILDDNGFFDSRFFSQEIINNDKNKISRSE